ncbi:histone deacetylase [Bacterioplanes sanyensis]|uniref:Histone deacetylase n=1 Tax=Bacterioplanes sanyensis TaxID=1249553 RepID=A0A222FGK1_9GAMM|nr:histone deacetylase [Bacterioplanes sanyensis]ASP37870.1 histone deacetylase [Bacterioplanes sanyensis]
MTVPLVYHPNYSCPFPGDHRFVMSKFVRLYQYCQQWDMIDGNLHQPETASIEQLSIVHDLDYLHGLVNNNLDARVWRRTGLPWSQGLIERTLTAPNGTLLTARLALEHGLACHLAGGTHHAHRDFGSGFCLVNDLAYCAQTLLEQGEVQRVLIFDLDVHQGDGTAAILANEPRALTCSIHCEKNFPFRKAVSDVDIGLETGLEDDAYLDVVERTLIRLLDEQRPDLVLYDAGADVWQHDALGHLNISWQGVKRRDELVLQQCLQRHIPVATVIGGGYDSDHQRLAQRHASAIEAAFELAPLYL